MKTIIVGVILCIIISIVFATRVQEKRIINSQKLGVGVLKGPEGIAWDPIDRDIAYTGIADGSIRRVNVTTGDSTHYAYVVPGLDAATRATCGVPANEVVCGRPLGLIIDKNNDLLVADAYKGILKISRANPNNVEVLVDSYNGVKFKMANGIELLRDGRTLFFTDTSQTYTRAQFVAIVLANKPDGRLFKFDLVTKSLTVEIADLKFANGIALSKDQSFLVVNECSERRIRKYYITGRKAGRNEIFVQDIGGYNDNIKADGEGNFLVGLFSATAPEITIVQTYPKIQNNFLTFVPPLNALSMIPSMGLVKKIDERGRTVTVYSDTTAQFALQVSEADIHDGYLYLCSVLNQYLTKVNLRTDLA
jgi:sugar lactone lactonase YvrE